MKNKDGFFKMISADLKRGAMREVYTSDALAVLAVADSFYIASDYTVSEDGYVAFLVNSKMIRAMLVDSAFLENLLTTTDQQTLSQMMFRLTDKTFRSFTNPAKGKKGDTLTHKFVDHELEEWISDTFGAPPARETAAKSSVFRSLKDRFQKNSNK